MLRIGDWCVDPKSGPISRDGETARLEERTLRLLLCLASHAGEVVSIDDLLTHIWPGVAVSPDSVYQAVATLRRQLGDNPRKPVYISTVPRLGYRLVAALVAAAGPAVQYPPAPAPRRRARLGFARATAASICLTVIAIFLFRGKIAGNNHAATPPSCSR